MVDCGLLRHLAAFLILLVWTKLSLVVASHPAFPCDRYLPMLAKVFVIPSIALCPKGSLYGHFLLLGSLFVCQGPYFQCFGSNHVKNDNLVCMYTAMSVIYHLSVVKKYFTH